MEFRIKNKDENEQFNDYEYPKYVKQIINLINQNTQATRPNNVGQLSDLFPEYASEKINISVKSWDEWYKNKMGDTITPAVDKIMKALPSMRTAIDQIDRAMVENYIKSLIIDKTYEGLNAQYKIISLIGEKLDLPFRRATKEEESKNIDGFISDIPVQVKPETFKITNPTTKMQEINCVIIYYKKEKNETIVSFDETYFKSN